MYSGNSILTKTAISLLKACGAISIEGSFSFYTVFVRIFYLLGVIWSATACFINTKYNPDIKIRTYAFAHALSCMEPLFRIYILAMHEREIKNVLRAFDETLPRTYQFDEKEKKFFDQLVLFQTRLARIFFPAFSFSFVCWLVPPLFDAFYSGTFFCSVPWWLPFELNLPRYLGVYFTQLLIGLVQSCGWMGFDAFFVAMLTNACTHFDVLQSRFDGIQSKLLKSGNETTENVQRSDAREELKQCIKYHQDLLTVCQNIEAAFTTNMMIILLNYTIVMTVLEFHIFSGSDGSTFTTLSPVVAFLVVLMVFLFLDCYFGHLMMEKSQMRELNSSDVWTDFEDSEVSTFLIVLQRCQKPFHVTAKKLFKLNLNTYINVVKMAYSLVTILNRMKT